MAETSNSQDTIYSYRPLFGNWQIYSFIGEGSYGKVYKIVRQEFGFTYTSAVKIITVPSKDQLKQALSSFGDNQEDLKLYFSEMVSNIVKEINILYKLKSCPNIVSYEDHMVIEKKEDIGWDILIRMEYLTPLPEYLKRNRLNTRDIINLGIDILSAISLCHKNNIIHRDIKDENIFITDNKTFKLGDFGIARELSKSGKASSFKGTPIYMSPEVFKAEKYDVRSDIYSLGILLYKLTNKSRIPFMPAYPESIRYSDFDLAIDKRLKGLPLTLPSHSGKELGAIILKACSYNVSNRYQTPSDMSDELKKLLLKLDKSFLNKDITFINQPEPESTVPLDIEAPKAPAPVQKPERKEIKKGLIIGLSVSLVIIIAAAGYFIYLFFKSSIIDKEMASASTQAVFESAAEIAEETNIAISADETIKKYTYYENLRGYLKRGENYPDQPAKGYSLAYSGIGDHPYATIVLEGIESNWYKSGGSIKQFYYFNNSFDSNVALDNTNKVIGIKPDVFICWQIDSNTNNAIYSELTGTNIPVIGIDFPISGAPLMKQDNFKIGELIGEKSLEFIEEKGGFEKIDKVVYLGQPSDQELKSGLANSLSELYNFNSKLIEIDCSSYDSQEIKKSVIDVFKVNQQIKNAIFFSINDDFLISAINALKENGLWDSNNKWLFFTVGVYNDEVKQLIKNGIIDAGIGQLPEKYGEYLIPAALSLIHDEQIPEIIYMENEVITKDNIDKFYTINSIN